MSRISVEQAQLLEAYFSRLVEIRQSGAGVKEESYYDALSNLLNGIGNGLKPRVRCILQLVNRGAGRPDGGLFTEEQVRHADLQKPLAGQMPARGAIEVKPTSNDAWVTAETTQVTRYWQHYGQVLVTNYRDFLLVGRDQEGNPVNLETYRLAQDKKEFWEQAAHPRRFTRIHAVPFAEFLHRVMLHAATLVEPDVVAWFLASYGRTAMARIEGKDLPALAAVRSALEEALGVTFTGDKGEHFFRSTFVQTLFYGVFSAWVLWAKEHPPSSKDRFRWQDTSWYLQVPIVQKLFYMMAEPEGLRSLGLVEVLDWTASVLNRVSRADFFADFEEGLAVQYFYEPFLEAFDPELRKELGVWYTPPEVVQYMVARVDRALREELGLANGLAEPNVFVLDPCCGTGSYLVEVLRCIHQTLREQRDDALVGADVKSAAVSRVFGFEILPAPFVVAHLQLGLLLQNLGAPLSVLEHQRAGVYLTNALTGWEPLDPEKEKAFQAMLTGFPELLEERDRAKEVKQAAPILVVLGNPPYNAFAGVTPEGLSEQQTLVSPYKEGLVKEWGIRKFNLDDLYIRFFRLAERRIAEQTGRGVVSYISNFSYLSDPSFVVMRQRFLKEFDWFWFDNLNGDSRETGKRTPDGKPDPSVFSTDYNKAGIRLGTTVSVLVRKEERDAAPEVRYREFWGVSKRGELLQSLQSKDHSANYTVVHPREENRFSFRPTATSPEYDRWPKVVELCAENPISGLQEMRKGDLMAIGRAQLEKRMQAYLDTQVEWDVLEVVAKGLTQNGGGFEARSARTKLLSAEEFTGSCIRRYALYPLDNRWCYYSTTLPLWNRPRPELASQSWKANRFFVTRMVAERPHENVVMLVTPVLPDYHLLRPNAVAIPFMLKPEKSARSNSQQYELMGDSEDNEPVIVANLSVSARQYLISLGITEPDADETTASLLWMHALAIGYSPAYLGENRDGVRQDWPRIPLPNSREALEASAALGEQIAALLDTEARVLGVTTGTIKAESRVIAPIKKEGGGQLQPGDLALSVGWGHHGQNNVVMPGKGKVIVRDYTPDERDAIGKGAEALGLSADEAFARLGEQTCDVYLNDKAFWTNVPKAVWDFVIGGYQVVKKWLSYREREILGRPLTVEEALEVTNMARRLASILLRQPTLDANYLRCKTDPYEWLGPAALSATATKD